MHTDRAPRRFSGVLLDLFGTLVPTGSEAGRRANLEAMARGLGAHPQRFAQRWLNTFDDRTRGRLGDLAATIERLSSEAGGRSDPPAVARAAEVRLGYVRELFERGRDSLPALDALRGAGIRLAVVSDTSDDTLRVWGSSDLARRFDATVFSCIEAMRKPEPAMYQRALERLGLPAAACAFIGDGGSHELTGALEVGLSAFQYAFPENPEAVFRVDPETDWDGPRLRRLVDVLSTGPDRG